MNVDDVIIGIECCDERVEFVVIRREIRRRRVYELKYLNFCWKCYEC